MEHPELILMRNDTVGGVEVQVRFFDPDTHQTQFLKHVIAAAELDEYAYNGEGHHFIRAHFDDMARAWNEKAPYRNRIKFVEPQFLGDLWTVELVRAQYVGGESG